MKIGELEINVSYNITLWQAIKLRIAGKEAKERIVDKVIEKIANNG